MYPSAKRLIGGSRLVGVAHEGERTKIVQLGCGITGLVCAELLTKNSRVGEVVLADSRTDPAKAMMKRSGSGKLSVVTADASDPRSLKKLLRGKDLVISSVPWELHRRVFRAACDAGVDYVDFSLTADNMEEFKQFHALCGSSGIRAITGAGEDPGMSDVFARHGANILDSAEEAYVRDGDSGSAEGYDFFSLWSPVDMVEEATTPALVFRDGKHSFLPPLHKREMYEFPEPIGPLPVYNTTHEETYMIPAFIKGIRHADFKIAIDDNFAAAANTLRRLGLSGLKPVDVRGVQIRPIDLVVALMPRPVDMAGKVKGYAGVVVEVIGLKDGRRTKVKVWMTMSHERAYELCRTNATGYLVGSGGAVAAEMLIEGDVKDRGLLVPEQLPAEKFIARLHGKEIFVKESIEPA